MGDKIKDALSPGFIARMQWWAFFTAAGGVPIASSFPIEGPGGNGGGFHASVPLMLGIVHDTETAIDALPARYAQVVKQFWLFEGRPLRWHGRHRGVSYHTFEVWVLKGHELLKAEFASARGRWERQVEEAEAHMTPEMHRIRMQNEAAEQREFA